MRSNLRLATVALALLAGGCSRSGEENLGLEVPGGDQGQALDVANLATTAELERAVALPGRTLDRLLGARRLDSTAQLKIEVAGRPTETLEDTFRLDSDGHGALHLTHDTSHDEGMEAVVAGGTLYVRPRYGRFVGRRPEGDDLGRLRATVEGVAADDFSLLRPWLEVHEAGRTEVAGRAGVRLKLSASPSPSEVPHETAPGRLWRNHVQVRYIDGEVVADATSGAPLAVKLETAYRFERARDHQTVTVTLALHQTTGKPDPIVAPTDAVIDPHRPRPMLDRHRLLEGLK
jgi:hypothetical protein